AVAAEDPVEGPAVAVARLVAAEVSAIGERAGAVHGRVDVTERIAERARADAIVAKAARRRRAGVLVAKRRARHTRPRRHRVAHRRAAGAARQPLAAAVAHPARRPPA